MNLLQFVATRIRIHISWSDKDPIKWSGSGSGSTTLIVTTQWLDSWYFWFNIHEYIIIIFNKSINLCNPAQTGLPPLTEGDLNVLYGGPYGLAMASSYASKLTAEELERNPAPNILQHHNLSRSKYRPQELFLNRFKWILA